MYRLQVLHSRHWKWGIVEYPDRESAERRVADLAVKGIKARVRRNEELFA